MSTVIGWHVRSVDVPRDHFLPVTSERLMTMAGLTVVDLINMTVFGLPPNPADFINVKQPEENP